MRFLREDVVIPQLAGAVLALSDLIDAYHARMTADIAKGLSRSDDDEWMANRCQRLRRTLCGDLAEEQDRVRRDMVVEDAEYEAGEAS